MNILSIFAIIIVAVKSAPPDGFVYTEGSKFMLNGKPYYFAGANCYDLFTFGSGSGDTETQYMNKQDIDNMMSIMEKNGVEVVRTWGFNTNSWHAFQTGPNTYNEQEFDEFDYIALSAKNHNIKLIVTLTNYWTDYGGISQYLEWANQSTQPNQGVFFNNTAAIQIYKDYVQHFISRQNHYTNISYAQDPTIMAWEVCNEPRHQDLGDNNSSVVLRAWMDEVGAFIKKLAPNHLISSGIEGHGQQYGYGGNEGNNFIIIHESPYIDFCSAHLYPEEYWANLNMSSTKTLIERWINDCQNTVGKPFFLGEFNVEKGSGDNTRSDWWTMIYDTIESNNGGGDAFWWFEYTNVDGEYGVMDNATELQVFQKHSQNMQKKSG